MLRPLGPRHHPLRVPAVGAEMLLADPAVLSHHLASIVIERGLVVLHLRCVARAAHVLDEGGASIRR